MAGLFYLHQRTLLKISATVPILDHISPFRNEQYRNQWDKATEKRTVIKKLSFAPRSRAALSLTIAAQILRCRGTFFFCYSGAIFERSRSLSIDYSGAKYVRSALKIALTWKSLFRVVENGKFLNRLRNVHLEKSVATGICRVRRSPKTAKTPLKVHLRLRFQNL